MIEQEMKAIRKIKEKQRKEIEQMVEYEIKMNQIKEKNEANMRLQADKEARHRAEIESKRKQQEFKKQQDEILRKQKQEAEHIAMTKRTQELRRREEEAKKKQELLEMMR